MQQPWKALDGPTGNSVQHDALWSVRHRQSRSTGRRTPVATPHVTWCSRICPEWLYMSLYGKGIAPTLLLDSAEPDEALLIRNQDLSSAHDP